MSGSRWEQNLDSRPRTELTPEILPYRKDDCAKLIDLNRDVYNGKWVDILFWDKDSERYAVRIHDNQAVIKVKPSKLMPNSKCEGYMFDRIAAFHLDRTLKSKPSIDALREIKPLLLGMPSLCDEYFTYLTVNWAEQLQEVSDTTIQCEVMEHLQTSLERVSDRREKLKIIRTIARIDCCLGKFDSVIELLEPWIDEHYGFLPSICTKLFDAYAYNDDFKKGTILFWKAIDIINRQVYNPICHLSSFFRLYLAMMLGRRCILDLDEFFEVMKSDLVSLIQDAIAMHDKFCYRNSAYDRYELRVEIALERAILFYAESKYENCFEMLSDYMNYYARRYGSTQRFAQNVYGLRFLCFRNMGDRKNAKYSLKKLKEHGISEEDLAEYEKILKKIPKTRERVKTQRVRSKYRCSDPFCNKVEQKQNEFKSCARCKVARYCSAKCQKAHWKRVDGHKIHCQKCI